ncbi:hypothetical protein Cgig2_000349 [Carnegiea gigantea]|uniref:Uncharacterized protein n=1 Tax=Carnegiea gigantea TaxID=171969 RepID=A0A9Q1QG18_9CARY|nr:hypothetical protein Cgig2_000349 [Carnegiea gigantea]
MNRFKDNVMLKLMEMLPNRILSIKLSRNNPIRNPSAIQLDPNLLDPLFIQIEMRPVESLKLCAGFVRRSMKCTPMGNWNNGTTLDSILKDSGISLNQAQISGFPGAKSGADAQPATSQTPIQPMPSIPVSQFLYDTLVRGPGVSTTSGLEGKSGKYRNYVGFDSPYVTQNNKYYLKYMGIRRHLNMKYFN